jgi:hypothetical protein
MCKYCEPLPNEFVSSVPINYCPFCGRNLHDEIMDELSGFFDDDDNFTYEKIDISDVKVGDYIAIDGDSSFCHFEYSLISKIKTKYNEDTGQQYKLLIDEDNYEWNSSTGYCRNGLYAYYIVGFYRKKYTKRNRKKYTKRN